MSDRKDKHVKPSGPIVDFYFSASAQYKKGERIPISVNGHSYVAVVGSRNKLPKEVVEVLQNARSRTSVPDLASYNPDKGGVPRNQEAFFSPKTTEDYQCDFDIEIIGEK